jgi:membrane-bound lytic murein transglycosylase B
MHSGIIVLSLCALLFNSLPSSANESAASNTLRIVETDSYERFIHLMVKQHGFQEARLREQLQHIQIQPAILEAIAKPAEAKPWFQYREIFLTEARIAAGVQFWRENEAALTRIEQHYGVPAEILLAIVGVETKYGANMGKYRVIDALATLGFARPQRSEFFQKELENFLLISRTEQLDPLQPIGSYAGAMGLPQFMPSSFSAYAVDFDQDGKRDIWHTSSDALASIANYLSRNQWQSGQAIAYPVTAHSQAYQNALDHGVKPNTTVKHLRDLSVSIPKQLSDATPVKLLSFAQLDGEELWIGLHNFYVITRYNHSPLYAMAVFQLSQALAERKKSALPAAKL